MMVKTNYLYLIFLFVLFPQGTIFAQSGSVQAPQIAIKVELGQSITLDDAQVTFTELREDSRCPRNTTCIWAGRARVIVQVKENDQEPKEYMIILGEVMPDESPNKKVLQKEEYNVVVEQLKPYPGDDSHTETTPTLLLVKREN